MRKGRRSEERRFCFRRLFQHRGHIDRGRRAFTTKGTKVQRCEGLAAIRCQSSVNLLIVRGHRVFAEERECFAESEAMLRG